MPSLHQKEEIFSKTLSDILLFINKHKIEVFSLVLIWTALLLSSNAANRGTVTTQSKAETPVPSTLSGNLEIAKNILVWTSSKKDSRGIYFLTCNDLSCVNPTVAGLSGHGGIPMIWGRFQYFLKTNDQGELTTLNTDLINYSDKTKIPFIQNQNWNCKLMYEIASSALVSTDVKTKAENLCMSSQYFPLDASALTVSKDLADYLAGRITLIPKLVPLNEKGIKEFPYYVSDFVAKYHWKGDLNYLDTAKNYFDASLRGYISSKDKLVPDDICAIGVSSVDLYDATSDNNYLDFAKQLFNREFNFFSPVCGIFADALFKITNNSSYYVKKNLVLTSLVQNKQIVSFDLRKAGLLIGLLSK